MCGIAGIVVMDSRMEADTLVPAVDSMVSILAHRGPDSRGVVPLRSACLGSCRLAILDLSQTSNQPFKSPDSGLTIVFNGEIFNYLELRAELKGCGHRFVSDGDTEVLVHAYEEWGSECLNRLDGMFAFAIHDSESGLVFLARDRFGIKPLYFSRVGGKFLFASEPQALLQTRLVDSKLDRDTARHYLQYGITDYGLQTFYEAIKQLTPGTSCTLANGQLSFQTWYDPRKAIAAKPKDPNVPSLANIFRTRLEESIGLRMRSDVPVGILLSGGLDSSSIAGFASRFPRSSGIQAFMVSFPGSGSDEASFATLAANSSGIHLTIRPASTIDLKAIVRCVKAQGEPTISPSVVAQWLIMSSISECGLRVALSGQGADEVLGGYEYFEAYALSELLACGAAGAAAAYALDSGNIRRLPKLIASIVFVHLPPFLKRQAWYKPWLRRTSEAGDPAYEDALFRSATLRDMILFHLSTRLPELLRYEDRNSMAFSIETRHPFLDHNLVEFALSLPSETIIGHRERKHILRLAAGAVVPREILARREKIGFETPDAWLKTREFRETYDRLCREAPPEIETLIDLSKARKLPFAKAPRKRKDLWRIFNFLLWYETCLVPLRAETSGAVGV